jgi:hypothetical protein
MLDYKVEPSVDSPNTKVNDGAFIREMTMIGGHNTIEVFSVCGMYLFSIGFGFKNVTDGTTVMSKVVVPLTVSVENAHHFVVKVETDTEWILGSYGPKEHDVCITMKLPNGGHLNRVFKQVGVANAPRSMPITIAFAAAMRKWKADTSGKGKVAPVKKVGVVKTIHPKP